MNNSIIPMDFMSYVVDFGDRPYIEGQQIVMRFPNNYGVSIVRNKISYGHEQGLYEIAIIKFDSVSNDDYKLVYDTPITSDVLGWQTKQDVYNVILQVMNLP